MPAEDFGSSPLSLRRQTMGLQGMPEWQDGPMTWHAVSMNVCCNPVMLQTVFISHEEPITCHKMQHQNSPTGRSHSPEIG